MWVFGNPQEGQVVTATDATWADDSAFPTAASSPHELLSKTQRLTSLVLGFCEGHGMAPNLHQGKTNLMKILRGKGLQAATRSFFGKGERALHLLIFSCKSRLSMATST